MRFSLFLLGIPIGILLGQTLITPSIQKTLLKAIRQKISILTETHTVAITDFAGSQVSLDSFCEKILGPEVFYKENNGLRKPLTTVLLLFSVTVAVITFEYFY